MNITDHNMLEKIVADLADMGAGDNDVPINGGYAVQYLHDLHDDLTTYLRGSE